MQHSARQVRGGGLDFAGVFVLSPFHWLLPLLSFPASAAHISPSARERGEAPFLAPAQRAVKDDIRGWATEKKGEIALHCPSSLDWHQTRSTGRKRFLSLTTTSPSSLVPPSHSTPFQNTYSSKIDLRLGRLTPDDPLTLPASSLTCQRTNKVSWFFM